MEMKELLEFVSEQNEKLISSKSDVRLSERVLARMVKLTEEVGELADEVLASQGDQRQEKMGEKNKESLENEVADVLITTLLLAEILNVDVSVSLEKKMKKIRERVYVGGR